MIKLMFQIEYTPPHKFHIGQKQLKTVPKEYQQRIHQLEKEIKLKEDTIANHETNIETLREALEDAEKRISAKETELQGTLESNEEVCYSMESCIDELIYISIPLSSKSKPKLSEKTSPRRMVIWLRLIPIRNPL